MTDLGTERCLLTSRWMLWLAPAGLRGGLKLEAYHQSRQPQFFFLCGPRCFWDLGSWFRTFRGQFSRAVAAAVSSSTSPRRPRLCVAAQASRTSHSRCSCSFRRCGVLYHVMSRQACLLSTVPQDVAASQYVCRRGADNLTLRRLLASRCHWFLQVVAATADAWWIIVQYVNKFPSCLSDCRLPHVFFSRRRVVLVLPLTSFRLRRLRRTFPVHLHQVA